MGNSTLVWYFVVVSVVYKLGTGRTPLFVEIYCVSRVDEGMLCVEPTRARRFSLASPLTGTVSGGLYYALVT